MPRSPQNPPSSTSLPPSVLSEGDIVCDDEWTSYFDDLWTFTTDPDMMRSMNLLRPVKRSKIRTTNSQHAFPRFPNLMAGLVVSAPNQVWVADITYIRLKHSFIYLAVLMDVFTRSI